MPINYPKAPMRDQIVKKIHPMISWIMILILRRMIMILSSSIRKMQRMRSHIFRSSIKLISFRGRERRLK
jgi:hypothetical protein